MPTVLKIGPFRFFFFSAENGEPAHIHITTGRKEAKVWLAGIELAYSYGFKPHELTQLLVLTRENKELLLEAWNEHFKHTA